MDNNQRPKFDPETGRPLDPTPQQPTLQPEQPPRPRFDPETGLPLNPPEAAPAQPAEPPRPRFDPETGRPLTPPPAEPQRLDNTAPSYLPPQPPPSYSAGTVTTERPAPTHKPANGLAIGSLVCGLFSMICCCCGWISIILGIVAVVLAIVSKRDEKMSGMAIGGLVCGIIGAAFALISVIITIAFSATGTIDSIVYDVFGYDYFS